ncbi:helix-turn-helix domain-containing protein [Halopenitus sp. H-Gu1]|uniref:AlbA family DNA-binding domain-containing protein n=1 Tax=Halopenitus sp. H-Gu1 TaxID=3242697 RepID=UPI00359E9D89
MPHEDAPQRVLQFLDDEGYNPSSPIRSQRIAEFVLQDLLHINKKLQDMAQNEEIAYQLSYNDFPTKASGANLVLGPVSRSVELKDVEYPIAEAEPDEVWFALNIESLMTRHQQNRGNCLKRMQSALLEARLVENPIVMGGLLLTNTSEEALFEHLDSVRDHDDPGTHVDNVISDLERMDTRLESTDVLGAIVVNYDGMSPAELHTDFPAPSETDEIHYDLMVSRISNEIDKQFLGLPDPQTDTAVDFIDRGEGRTIEFKDPRASADDIAKVAASMLNTDGGVILVGVNDDGNLTDIPDTDQTQHDIANTFYERLGGTIGDIIIEVEEVDGNDVILIRIPPSQQTLYEVNGKFYIRIGESKKPMTSEVINRFFKDRFNSNPSDFLK